MIQRSRISGRALHRSGALLAACLVGATLVACSTQVDFAGYYGDGPSAVYLEGDGGAPLEGGITGDGSPSASPMLVKIDPLATMVQTPGQGVGVFAQYDPPTDGGPEGHWYIWWTCDTSISGEACDFAIHMSVKDGQISQAAPQGFASTDQLTGGADEAGAGNTSISANTTTTTTVQGVHFDTAPGVIVTLSAALGGEYSGSFLFFVQDGQVNGGFTGTLSDPLELQPSSP